MASDINDMKQQTTVFALVSRIKMFNNKVHLTESSRYGSHLERGAGL